MNLKSFFFFSVFTIVCVKALPFDVFVGHEIRDENYVWVRTADGSYVITQYFDATLHRFMPIQELSLRIANVASRFGDDSSGSYDHKDNTQSSFKAWENPKSYENQNKNFPSTLKPAQRRISDEIPDQVKRKEKPIQISQRQYQQQQQQQSVYVNSRSDPSSRGSLNNNQPHKIYNSDAVHGSSFDNNRHNFATSSSDGNLYQNSEQNYDESSAVSSNQRISHNSNKYKPGYNEETTTQKVNNYEKNRNGNEGSNDESNVKKWIGSYYEDHLSSGNKFYTSTTYPSINNQNQQNTYNNGEISFENSQNPKELRTTTFRYDNSQTDSQQSNGFNKYHDKDDRLTSPDWSNASIENHSNNRKNTEKQPFEATTSSFKPTWAPTVQPTVQQTYNVNKKPNTGLDFVLPDRKVEIEIEYPSPNYDIELTTRAPLPRPVISDKSSPLRPGAGTHSNQNPGNGKNPY